jgi:hypothetical protein
MRSVSSSFLVQIASPNVQPCLFVAMEFTSGTIYCWSGYGTVSWNSLTWTGVGGFGAISGMSATNKVQAQSLTLSLNGIPSAMVSNVINEANQTYSVNIYFGFLSNGSIVSSPIQVFSGATDVPTITCGPVTSDISVTCESPLIRLTLASNRIWTSNDQFLRYPTDNGFGFVPAIQDWDGNWGTNGGQNPAMSGRALGSGSGSGSSAGVGSGSNYGNPYGSKRNG